MAATRVIDDRSWRHSLVGRDRDFRLFNIPAQVVATCGVAANTKRQVIIRLSTGRTLRGFCTITSGTELSIPTEFREEFRNAEWFDCEVVGNQLGDVADLHWATN
ncbi:MAG TPA: hypothetical protein VG122_19015 [Gemmata sp.]|jgi:hypothetical protein|nr:hypothetical protein [Gemmata sp.]